VISYKLIVESPRLGGELYLNVDGRKLGFWSIPEFVQAVVREALRRKG